MNTGHRIQRSEWRYTSDSLLSGRAGTVCSIAKDKLFLHNGCLLIDTGKEPIRVGTRIAGLKIEADTAVLLEYLPKRLVRILFLSGKPEAVKVRSASQPLSIMTMQPGEQLMS